MIIRHERVKVEQPALSSSMTVKLGRTHLPVTCRRNNVVSTSISSTGNELDLQHNTMPRTQNYTIVAITYHMPAIL